MQELTADYADFHRFSFTTKVLRTTKKTRIDKIRQDDRMKAG